MKRFSKIFLGLIMFLGLSVSVSAASYSNSIKSSKSGTSYEYINGIEIFQNKASSYNLYVLDIDTYFDVATTLTDPITADSGFAYIIQNSNVTSSSNKNYYIAQVAILWYQDYLNGNDNNISSSMKDYIASNTKDTVCYYINKLVNSAKNYSQNNDNIVFNTKDVSFSKSGSYYYSNNISVTTNNLKSKPTVKLYNAPTSASIVNNSLLSNGTGSFQIRIPSNSMSNSLNNDFEVYITGSSSLYDVPIYSQDGMNSVIYGRVYSSASNNVEASLPVVLTENNSSTVRVRIMDSYGDYVSGVNVKIYRGDCENKTCSSSNLVSSYTTTSTFKTFNELVPGDYTIYIDSDRYDFPEKSLITVFDSSSTQYIDIYSTDYSYDDDDFDDYISSSTFTITNPINDPNNYIRIYDLDGNLIEAYESSNTEYEVTLKTGDYYIVDDYNIIEKLFFNISSTGVLTADYGDGYKAVNNIDLYTNNDDYTCDDNCNLSDDFSIDIDNNVDTDVNVSVEVVDCPSTNLFSTIKYVIGAIILALGGYLVFRNVKKFKNNN